METIERDYSPKGVKFYYIYKALAHPETNGYVAPFTLKERLMHVAEAKRKIGSRFNWICDAMANDLKHALGNAPNSEFVVDPAGKLVRVRQWSRPEQLRQDLVELVGRVESPTTIDQVNMRPLGRPKTAATGVVPRLKLPGRMMPVKVLPVPGAGGEPFYAKLRAEVDSGYFQDGEGQLYLGFFLDPLYKVHWNNQVMPIEYELESPGDVTVTPSSGEGPDVKDDADADPREFLVDISGSSRKPIVLVVRYMACDDAETFCKPVTQRYEVLLERDRDGGSRRSSGRMSPGAPARPSRSGPEAMKRRETLRQAVQLFKEFDADEDGNLNQQEWAKMDGTPAKADTDSNSLISLKELIDWLNQE